MKAKVPEQVREDVSFFQRLWLLKARSITPIRRPGIAKRISGIL
ncbi:hypothetical protein SAMN05216361_1441 [Marisediminitalea aggregata]|uniref:Uncharacterized protein n=1 Tax=Marisediminitalea aggregata TaxID=634436 RepID=A0A1M5HEP2_9ALTE|nr:hypothetical protein SAMN05216361_1441 [Marisediminitalea aggregata]